MQYFIIFILISAVLVLIFSPFYFAKKFGSRLAFLGMGYGVLILTLFGAAIVFWSNLEGEGLVIWALYPLIVLILPGYIMLTTLIYFFWPLRFEPVPDDSMMRIKKFKQWSYVAWSASFLIPLLCFYYLYNL